MRLLFCWVLLLLVAVPLVAGDVSGKWSGNAQFKRPDGTESSGEAFCTFQQKGAELTGTCGEREEEQIAISKGQVEGETIRFDIEAPERTFKIELKLVSADKLDGTFTFKTDEGAEIKGKLALNKKA